MTAPDEHRTQDMGEALQHALRDLPVSKVDGVMERLAAAIADFDRTDSPDELVRFATSVLITAKLHSNRRFLKALHEDEMSERPVGMPQPVDIAAEFAEARAARSA